MSHHYMIAGDNVTPLYDSWEQYSSGECCTHSWTRGLSVASGSLRPFGPVSGLNVARGSSVLYLTRGDNVTPLYDSWEQYSSGECCTHSWTRGSSLASGSLRPFGSVSGLNVAR